MTVPRIVPLVDPFPLNLLKGIANVLRLVVNQMVQALVVQGVAVLPTHSKVKICLINLFRFIMSHMYLNL